LDLTQAQLQKPLETMAQRPIPGLRLIPYRAVGQDRGMLLALRFPQVYVGSRKIGALVAFAPEAVGEGDCYQALTGGALL
jgi:stage II sporulation protein GA (sporulation sigma-E factor processing peptidase)